VGGGDAAEGLAGSFVELGGDLGQALRGVDRQVGALGVPLCLSSGWSGGRRVVFGGPGK
jgi:hypothetical protein